MYGVMTNAPFVERATALQWNFTGDGLGILHWVEGDAEAFEATVADVPEVLDYDLEPVDEASFYVYIRDETTEAVREMFEPLTHGGLIMVPPIVYREDGTVSLSIFGPDDELQAALDLVPPPIEVDVESVSGLSAATPTARGRLSDRQREAVDAAIELGYYEIPREASHEDVADALECAPSTAAEHLRKGESELVRTARQPP